MKLRIKIIVLFLCLTAQSYAQQGRPAKKDIIEWVHKTLREQSTYIYLSEDHRDWKSVETKTNGTLSFAYCSHTGTTLTICQTIIAYDEICSASMDEEGDFINVSLKNGIDTNLQMITYDNGIKTTENIPFTIYEFVINIKDENIKPRVLKALIDIALYNCPKKKSLY